MRSDGVERVGLWREAGAWWDGEPQLEIERFRDARGRLHEEIRSLPSLVSLIDPGRAPDRDDAREDVALRPRKVRDEKVRRACGRLSAPPDVAFRSGEVPYAAFHVFSGYSFGRSPMLAQEIPRLAAERGIPAIVLADRFSLAGCVEFVHEAKRLGIKSLVGATFELADGGEIVLVARDKAGYANLSRLVTACHLEEPRCYPLATWERLERFSRGLLCLTGGDGGPIAMRLLAGDRAGARACLDRLVGLYGRSNVAVEIERSFLPWQREAERGLLALAEEAGVLACAGGPITHARRADFPAQDVLVCAETLCTVEEIFGRKAPRHPSQPPVRPRPARALNAERFLRSASGMARLFADRPELLRHTLLLADRCDDEVLPGRTQLPAIAEDEPALLRALVEEGARRRWGTPNRSQRERLAYELERIVRLGFAGHFLVAWDFCRWARERGIHLSGRGSVVDSAVAYCLGLSRIDAWRHRLHFDRFLPDDGSKRPDIDIDFEARRRDEVRAYVVERYGREHVATVAAFGALCTRGIVREVGKALGIPEEALGSLAKRIHGGVAPEALEEALERRPELRASGIAKERFRWVFRLARTLADVPRTIRSHSSGVVVSASPIAETVPVQWSAAEGVGEACLRILQWDKRSAKHFFDKFDLLCLRGQDVLAGTQERIEVSVPGFEVDEVPLDDPETYRALRSGETIGIPQSASPAMRQAHVRLRTVNLEDASLVQAGIRPGVGGAVKINELIARRRGKPYAFDHPALEEILGHTYGIVVFQEQVDQLLQTFCGYTSGEAEDIRDRIHARRREDYGALIRDELVERMIRRGIAPAVAEHVAELVRGFKGYGFAQGHALAFAEISVRSVYCQQNFPAAYFAALLSAQPAGYYGPCTLANEARARGVTILPVDVNRSQEEFTVEDVRSPTEPRLVIPACGVRVGLAQVAGLSASTRRRIVERREGGYRSLSDFCARVEPERHELEALVLCGAFDGLSPHRRALLWAVPAALRRRGAERGLWEAEEDALDLSLPDFTPEEKAVRERAILGLDIERHLMAFERERVASRGGITTAEARRLEPGRKAVVVGNAIRLRFPPTPSGKRVVFFDLEDETGLLNVTCFDAVYRRDGHTIVCSPYVTLVGEAQDRDGHTAFLAHRVFPYRPMLARALRSPLEIPVSTADFLAR